ncbi:MAG: hypothetical protein Q9201_005101 [Fulgogasparrea decipioides]
MHRLTRPDSLAHLTTRSQRSSSISSDRASLSVISLPVPPAVSPDPAYIAPASASQIVTGDPEPAQQEDDNEQRASPMAVNVTVAPNALYLVNAFLDQLLYSFLASSRSTSIASLRPAVTEVLKPRLAKDAIASADEELNEVLGAGDVEGLATSHYGIKNKGDWHLNTVWRRTRLRCMVYTRLGDLEEEDEEMWIERENAEHRAAGHHRLSRDLGVSPAAAIFLTSILEFIGEQVLLLSAEPAYARFEIRRRQEKHGLASGGITQPPSIEVVDIEKLALNTTFGRLWRSWKKRVRSPSISGPRPSSREYLLRPASSHCTSEPRSRHASIGDVREYAIGLSNLRDAPVAEDSERALEAAVVPLPATTDVTSETGEPHYETLDTRQDRKGRARSMVLASDPNQTADQSNGTQPVNTTSSRPGLLKHNRSSSLPQLSYRRSPPSNNNLFLTPREGQFATLFVGSPRGCSGYDSDPAVVTKIYDGSIEDSAVGGSKERTLDQSELSGQAEYKKETQDLNDGLDSLAGASKESQHLNNAVSNDTVADRNQQLSQRPTAVHISPAISHVAGTTGDQDDQQIPPRVEGHLDSMRKQGYTTENASLDNRETSIVETQSNPTSAYGGPDILAHGGPEPATAGVNNRILHANHDQSDGSTSADGQEYGSAIGSQPDTVANSIAGNSGPSVTLLQAHTTAKVSNFRKQLPPVRTSVERASVQRVSPSPGSALESPIRTSTSSSYEVRPIHTSGSNTSQRAAKPKGLGARESSDTSRQFAVSRQSSEGSGSRTSPAIQRPSVDKTQRNFEQLIKSDETIQYTLTPQSVREMDSPDSPRYSHSRTGTPELADPNRTSGAPPAEMGRSSTPRSIVSLKGLNGLRSNAPNGSKPTPMPTAAPIFEKPSMQSQRSRPTTARSAHGPPRDAHLGAETTRDFADFIRSTGPEQSSTGSDSTAKAASSASSRQGPMTPDQRSGSATSAGRKITKPNPSLSKSPPPVALHPPAKRATLKLQPREATYEPTHNEDLLDFLKQGPTDRPAENNRPTPGPVASVVPQNPRIPYNIRERHGDNARSSVASTHDSSFADRSIRSTNSRTGLLDSPRGTYGVSPPSSQRQMSRFDEPSQQPVRKQRRAKDPYSIDSDSEGDDHPGTPKPRRQEESLIDFLNSTPPPSEGPQIPSAFDDVPSLSIRSPNTNNSKPSKSMNNQRNAPRTAPTPGIRSAAQAPTSNPQQPPRGRSTQFPSHEPPQLPALNPRDISPTLTSNYNSNVAKSARTQRPNSLTAAPSNGATVPLFSSYPPSTEKAKPKPAGMARSERENPRGMADLADFLRNSEPPTQVPAEFRGKSEEVEDKDSVNGKGVWGRLKGRRKGR